MSVMPTTMDLADGRLAACEILEIVAVPYFELIADTAFEASGRIDSLFARMANDISRRADAGDIAAELLYVTEPAQNQTYRAQTRIFFVLRALGSDRTELTGRLADVARSVEFGLRESGYAVIRVASEASLKDMHDVLANVRAESVMAIGRQERVVGGQMGMSLYYNDVIVPSSAENSSMVTNALSQCPHVAVSMQLVPTTYTEAEQAAVASSRAYVDGLRSQVLMTPGAVVPSVLSDAAIAYVSFINTQRESAYYFNFLVYAPPSDARALSSKLLDLMLADDHVGSTALVVTDVTESGFSLTDGFVVSPWTNSDRLVYDCREGAYWDSPAAPRDLIRLKYLAPAGVLRAAFKAPFDDGKIIGIESKRSIATKDKLDFKVLAENSFRVGEMVDVDCGGASPAQAGVPLGDFARHALVVGASGYGKTNFALGMLLRFWREFNIPFLIVEPTKTEYRSLLDAIPDINVFTPGRNEVVPFIINPFVPPPNVTVESYIPSLMTAFNAAFDMPDPLPSIFRAVINDCYNHYGWKSTSMLGDPHARHFGFYEFIRMFKDKVRRLDYQGETKSNIESAGVVRLTSLLEQNANIYDTINTIPLHDLLAKPTIIELNAIGDKEQKSLLMALVLVALCAYTKSNAALDGKLKNILMIDEAHVLLGSGNRGADTSRSSTVEALEDMIAEIRAYGTGIVIADQSPVNVGRNIIANTDVKVLFRLVERENREMVASATNMDPSDESLLAQLGTGECLLHYGRLNAPLHVKVDDVREIASMSPSITNDRVRSQVGFWDSRPLLLRPYRECVTSRCCARDCDFETRVDAEFVAANIATRYLDYMSDWGKVKELLYLRLPGSVDAAMRQLPGLSPSQRLGDCTTIKVLRKILLAKNIAVTEGDVLGALRDERVMPYRFESVGVDSEGKLNGN